MYKPDNLYHIYNQGNNNQTIFRCNQDYLIFLKMIKQLIIPNADLLSYCLMPNYFRMMIFTDGRVKKRIKQGGLFIDPVTNGIRKLLSGYARVFNNRYNRTGSLFRQKTKGISLSEIDNEDDNERHEYFLNFFHDLHLDPVRAGLVSRAEDWEYSSYKDYALLRQGNLCNKILAVKFCGYDPLTFVETSCRCI